MSKKNSKTPAKDAAGTFDLSGQQILDSADGFARLLRVRLPAVLSMDLQLNFQALKFAATPVNDADTALADRFAKKDRKGRPVIAENGGTALRDPAEYWKERKAMLAKRQRVKVTPLKRSDIPEKVDGKPVIIEGEVFELLGPLLVD
jgi:hypothetical protein